jgi:uncharacterized iron-regulated protein/predicted small lipoprotein YifL
MTPPRHLAAAAFAIGFAASLAACGRQDPFRLRPADPSPVEQLLPESPWAGRALPMFRGRDGAVTGWAELMEAAGRCDVVIIGEQHDDAAAHEFELALVSDLLASFPGSSLALEMLERDEQPLVDALLAGELAEAAFIDRTGSANWGGRPWDRSYGRLVSTAARLGSPVVAANAPRRFVRQARTEGYESLRALPSDERGLFDLPRNLDRGRYRERLAELMRRARDQAGSPPPTEAEIDAALRPQMVWDATMARSIAAALSRRPRASSKVVHVVGRFHSDFDGGLVDELRRAAPLASILTISLVPEGSRSLREEDRGRADLVVYTRPRSRP